jgi:predicted enzyme related to lactoylglutathione lyase
MKIKSVSGITGFAKNLEKTAKFYEHLGFETRKRDAEHITVYSNWFWLDFVATNKETRSGFKSDAQINSKGAGTFIYLSVDDVDAFYEELVSKGLKPSKPYDSSWGNREFLLRDPNGYRLVIFKRK